MAAPVASVNIILYAAGAGEEPWPIAVIIWVMIRPVLFMMMIKNKDIRSYGILDIKKLKTVT